MSSEPDLHRAISLKPSPFHAHPHAHPPHSSRGSSPYPAPPASSSTPAGKADGASTAVETLTSVDGIDDTHARHVPGLNDVERQSLPQYTPDNDPYRLAHALKPEEELAQIRANTSRKRDGFGPLTLNKKATRARKLEQFYEKQNENIERLLKPVDDHVRDAKEEEGANHLKYRIAVVGSFAANIILAVLQLYAAASSKSLSLFTTMADSLFDPLSNLTLIMSARAVKRVDGRKFPSGKARIENAGNIFFCFMMITVSVVIIVESIREIATHKTGDVNDFYLPSVIAVCIAFGTKFSLFLYCWALRNKYSQVRILWEDHRNDLFINGFGVLTSVGGSKLAWWLDPAGAMVLSALIIFLWSRTAYSEFQLLIGVTADTPTLQLITYISMTHSPFIKQIDTVRAYHSGPRLIVEVDIVMDPEETLQSTHDVAEALQIKLESLPDVERAYVHVDYETDHAPEHFLKKEL
ncbi:cation diffusion facilitator 1 [Paraphaeosphaeria sporulosa]|uniref:Cation diffusion facilitator 1 n=1 Tax=Paraphaeosphaeria sporulosa TaxID=1460663 RepID=A0A177C2P7_9PLEO|nr:cation diffusion facilitator 1 [Paraphaeosphaeria sporulosa]OAG01923.1 cation diffusion facilitator 1 [Paraphaeosphaeria sporulosa]